MDDPRAEKRCKFNSDDRAGFSDCRQISIRRLSELQPVGEDSVNFDLLLMMRNDFLLKLVGTSIKISLLKKHNKMFSKQKCRL